jgi:acyl transferase domain-containing protein
MSRERIVVVCPGRGTYNQPEWGYLAKYHADKAELLAQFDAYRAQQRQPGLRELDQKIPYQLATHSRGDHASALIYACAWCDALSIDTARYEIVAVCGNSMGWYIALAVAGALTALDALHLINTMGGLMHESLIGGQLVYPWVDEQWRPQQLERARQRALADSIHGKDGAQVYLSIDLGGLHVFGGNDVGLKRLAAALPARERFPLRLHNHAAFHTPLQEPVKARARQTLSAEPFAAPRVPLIDGRGAIWTPYSTDPHKLWDYTLGHQLVAPYDFSRSVTVALKEFAPDRLVILGPGTTLGGAVAQVLIQDDWRGLKDKAGFQARQEQDPFVLTMGVEQQRAEVV